MEIRPHPYPQLNFVILQSVNHGQDLQKRSFDAAPSIVLAERSGNLVFVVHQERDQSIHAFDPCSAIRYSVRQPRLFLFREQEAHVLWVQVSFEKWALYFVSGTHDFLLRARYVSD